MEPNKPYSPSPSGTPEGTEPAAAETVADLVTTGIDYVPDAAHQTPTKPRDSTDLPAASATDTARTVDRNGLEVSQAFRVAVRHRPLTAIGVAAAMGYLLVRIVR